MTVLFIAVGMILVIGGCMAIVPPLTSAVGAGCTAAIVLAILGTSACVIFGMAAAYREGERDLGEMKKYAQTALSYWIFSMLIVIALAVILMLINSVFPVVSH